MKTTTRIRRTLAALALPTAVAAPVTVAATASPAAASGSCPPMACTCNHNEDAAAD